MNVDDTSMITSAMILSMKVLLFQWSQVPKNYEWKPIIDAWFGKFKIYKCLNSFFIIILTQLVLNFYWTNSFINLKIFTRIGNYVRFN